MENIKISSAENIYNENITEKYYKTVNNDVELEKPESSADGYLESLMPKNLEGKKTLDLGCGNGRYSELLCARGSSRVVGLDLSDSMLKQAQRRKKEKGLNNLDLVKSDIESLPFGDDSFDYVFSRFSLMYAKDLKKTIEKIGKSLKEGGEMLIETNVAEIIDVENKDKIKREMIPLILTVGENSVPIKNYAQETEDYLEAFKRAHLKVVDIRYFPAKDTSVDESCKYKEGLNFKYAVIKLVKE